MGLAHRGHLLARHLLHIYVLLHVGDLYFLLCETAIHLSVKRSSDATASDGLVNPAQELQLKTGSAKSAKSDAWFRVGAHTFVTNSNVEKHLFDLINVGSIGTCDFDADAFLLVRSPGLVNDLGVAHNRVGYCHLDVVTSQKARAA